MVCYTLGLLTEESSIRYPTPLTRVKLNCDSTTIPINRGFEIGQFIRVAFFVPFYEQSVGQVDKSAIPMVHHGAIHEIIHHPMPSAPPHNHLIFPHR